MRFVFLVLLLGQVAKTALLQEMCYEVNVVFFGVINYLMQPNNVRVI